MGHGSSDAFVDGAALEETIEPKGPGNVSWTVIGNEIGENVTGTGNCLKTAGAPATVDIETVHIGFRDDWRAVTRHIDDAAPHAQHPQAGNHRERFNQRRDRVLERRKTAALRVIVIGIRAAADGPLKGVLGYTDDKLVSMDFNHDPHSSVFHSDQTKVIDGTLCSILTWYDNEWGFSNRMADTAVAMGKLI